MSSSAPIVPTKVLGDPEELEKHLAMLQNGYQSDGYAGAAPAVDAESSIDVANLAPSEEAQFTEDRFVFAAPKVGSQVELHAHAALDEAPVSDGVVLLSGSHLTSTATESSAVELDCVDTPSAAVTSPSSSSSITDYLPEVESFQVQLKKDAQGLGITIAGYVCERGT